MKSDKTLIKASFLILVMLGIFLFLPLIELRTKLMLLTIYTVLIVFMGLFMWQYLPITIYKLLQKDIKKNDIGGAKEHFKDLPIGDAGATISVYLKYNIPFARIIFLHVGFLFFSLAYTGLVNEEPITSSVYFSGIILFLVGFYLCLQKLLKSSI